MNLMRKLKETNWLQKELPTKAMTQTTLALFVIGITIFHVAIALLLDAARFESLGETFDASALEISPFMQPVLIAFVRPLVGMTGNAQLQYVTNVSWTHTINWNIGASGLTMAPMLWWLGWLNFGILIIVLMASLYLYIAYCDMPVERKVYTQTSD